MSFVYADRGDAGRRLSVWLSHWRGRGDVIVLALPRGGVPVGREIAKSLGAPLDVLLVRKLGFPGHEELAMGAIASGGVMVLNPYAAAGRVPEDVVREVAEREGAELQRRERLYRGDRPPLDLRDRTAILVDDGLATGATMRAAVRACRAQGPAAVVVAVPVGSPEAVAALRRSADSVVCPLTPRDLVAIGAWYRSFEQLSDAEVTAILAEPR